MKKKEVRGRPPIGTSRMEAMLLIRLSDSDYRSLHKAASSNGEKLATWARGVLVEAARRK